MMDFQISETSTHDDKDALKYTSNLFPINTWPLADLRGVPDARAPGVQILSFFMHFFAKNLQNNPNLGIGAPLLGKILDPPLPAAAIDCIF